MQRGADRCACLAGPCTGRTLRPCASCALELYWEFDVSVRHVICNPTPYTPMPAFNSYVQRWARDHAAMQGHAESTDFKGGRGILGSRVVWRPATVLEQALGHQTLGGAFKNLWFEGYENRTTRVRPVGVPMPAYNVDGMFVNSWSPARNCWIEYSVSAVRGGRSRDFIAEAHTRTSRTHGGPPWIPLKAKGRS